MDEKIAQQILDELFPYFEAVETQSAAILQFLKDKGIASEAELAPHFTKAGNASSVRWRAARVRLNYLLLSAANDQNKVAKEDRATAEKISEPPPKTLSEPVRQPDGGDVQGAQKNADENHGTEDISASPAKSEKSEKKETNKDTTVGHDEGKDVPQNAEAPAKVEPK